MFDPPKYYVLIDGHNFFPVAIIHMIVENLQQCTRVAVWRLGEMLFRVDQRVSRISPSTIPAPLINEVAYQKKQLSWCPCTWNIPIALSTMHVRAVR